MKYVFILLVCLSFISCNNNNVVKDEIGKSLNKHININKFSKIRFNKTFLSFNDIQKRYKYVYLIYLKMDCISCYKSFFRWQKQMNAINKPNSVTALFIIRGNSYDEFIAQARIEGLKEDEYYTFMDPSDTYINGNKSIPEWIIKKPLLIDDKNRIRLIGDPFSNPKMKEYFYSIIQD